LSGENTTPIPRVISNTSPSPAPTPVAQGNPPVPQPAPVPQPVPVPTTYPTPQPLSPPPPQTPTYSAQPPPGYVYEYQRIIQPTTVGLQIIFFAGLILIFTSLSKNSYSVICWIMYIFGITLAFMGLARAYPKPELKNLDESFGLYALLILLIINLLMTTVYEFFTGIAIVGTAIFLYFAGFKPVVKRPLGIKLISYLGFLYSIFIIVVGILLMALSSMFGSYAGDSAELTEISSSLSYLGSILFLIGIIGVIATLLLLNMRKAGFFMVLIIGIIAIINSIDLALSEYYTNGNILGIVVWGATVGYLLTKRKLFFNQHKGVKIVTPGRRGLTDSPKPTHCPSCRRENKYKLEYCYYCGELF
jgi:hypothetical protein